jgi:hypothetical protein
VTRCCKRDPAPTPTVIDDTVLCELAAVPERHDHSASLEEHDLSVWRFPRPSERLIEVPRPINIGDAKRDE